MPDPAFLAFLIIGWTLVLIGLAVIAVLGWLAWDESDERPPPYGFE